MKLSTSLSVQTGIVAIVLSCLLSACADSSSKSGASTGQSVAGGSVTADDDTVNPQDMLTGAQDPGMVNSGPERDSGFIVDDRRYPLDSALGDIWGVTGDHYNVNFTLTNGNFRMSTLVLDGRTYKVLVPAESTAVFYANMYSPGDRFSFASYAYAPPGNDSTTLTGVGFFDSAFVGMDIDGDSLVSDEEQIAVIDGTIDFMGVLPDISITFSVTLANGQSVTGHYTGLFDFTQR